MREMRIGIQELQSLSGEEMNERIRGRIIDMYERLGDLKDATVWLWNDVAARQGGNF